VVALDDKSIAGQQQPSRVHFGAERDDSGGYPSTCPLRVLGAAQLVLFDFCCCLLLLVTNKQTTNLFSSRSINGLE